MKYIVTTAVLIIVGIVMLTAIADATEPNYDYVLHTQQESYEAVYSTTHEEYLINTYDVVEINFITVNTIALDLETDVDHDAVTNPNIIVLFASITDTDDAIVIEYTHLVYEPVDIYPESMRSIVNLMPMFLAIGILTFVVIMIKSKK